MTPSSILIFISSSPTGELCCQPIRGNVRRTGRMFPEHADRSFLDPEYSLVAVRRILRPIFAKQKFAQLRTNYIRRILPAMFATKKFAQLRTGLTSTGPKRLHVFNCIYFNNKDSLQTQAMFLERERFPFGKDNLKKNNCYMYITKSV